MLRRVAFLIVIAVLGLPLVEPAAHAQSRRRKTARFETEIKPLLQQYCYSCHGNGKKKGDFSLDPFQDQSSALADRDAWKKVLHNLSANVMPPEEKKQPTLAEREKLIQWIDTVVFQTDCDQPDPGRVTIRRLNRTEYNNTVRDLVGVSFNPADDFPADDVGYGFDNIGDVLSLSPILLEKY
ncbi:MAG: DUF1587 domain-containing protein, partial [Verrucomicrobiota bacterium]